MGLGFLTSSGLHFCLCLLAAGITNFLVQILTLNDAVDPSARLFDQALLLINHNKVGSRDGITPYRDQNMEMDGVLSSEIRVKHLLTFGHEAPPQTTYRSVTPAVFELEPPPSDPELGRASTAIWDGRDQDDLRAESVDYAHIMYGPGTSESDIDDGGPASPSTSPPGPSSLGNNFVMEDEPTAGLSALSKLANAAEDTTSDDSSLSRSVGHIRSPVLARRSHHPDDREPTPLETFSRTIRNYVPSSIPIPSAAPSPPRVSRPVSFGSFLSPSTHAASPSATRERQRDHDWKRRGSDASSAADLRRQWPGQRRSEPGGEMPVFSLDDDISEDGPREDGRQVTRYPGVGDTEEVLWAGWDTLADVSDEGSEQARTRSVLMLGYPSGLQLWDCSNLGSVSELLNLTGAQWGAVEFAGVLPDPPQVEEEFRPKRPLIGFSSRTPQGTDFLVYSLRTHEVVKRLSLIGFTSFAASSQFIILCTSNPPSLHIISSCTFASLYIIPSASLVPFTFPPAQSTSSPTKPTFNDVPSLDLDQHYPSLRASPLPRPIYALSNRLLAYVSPPSRQDAAPAATPGQAHTSVPITASEAPLKFGLGMSQADLGNAAVKIGGSVLSGMKTLGGIAFSAARAGVSAAVSGEQTSIHSRNISASGGSATNALGMFFSKSAPAATASPHEYQTAADRRRRSLRVSSPIEGSFDPQATVTPRSFPPPTSPTAPTSGCNVIVVDLYPLQVSSSAQPEPVAQFTFARPQALSGLKFSPEGTSLALCSKDGHAVRTFRLRPTPRLSRRPPPDAPSQDSRSRSGKEHATAPKVRQTSSSMTPEHLLESMQHVYTLRRGRTSAVVESLEWAHDKMWFGMSSRKRTIHVFATNPLGGKPDGSSHLIGRVVNSRELNTSSTELSPLVRVRLKSQPSESASIPCTFTFLRSSEAILPLSLLPPATVHFSASSSPSSVSSGLSRHPVSPAQRPTRPTNYKDLLVFDPNDGTLALHRIFVERAAVDQAVVPGSIPVVGGTSISLPGMSTFARHMGSSPPAGLSTSPRTTSGSGLAQMMDKPTGLVGRENLVSTWSLARGRSWPEVKQSLRQVRPGAGRFGSTAKSDWLSRAELSTFSLSPKVSPRLIYLSHQFSFYALGEDYHALIRSYHFDIPSSKIEVRKPIEVNAFASEETEAFVQDLSPHHDISMGRVPSSFDGPLASALSAQLHPPNPSPPVLPMLPNGTSGSGAKSLINAIPIRQVAVGIQDGMTEGIGRIRREFGKARSPRLAARPDAALSSSVPLEFDEEDEDFLVKDVFGPSLEGETEADVISRSASASTGVGAVGGDSAASISTPSTNIDPLPIEEDEGQQPWQGWGPEDKQAIDDAERFDDITVGFLDEEHETMRERETAVKKGLGKKRRGRRE
ncbi:hypothetical protein BD309DRAFT_894635 [Dichomitus squalens]|nr:hypothetical protein BD309DRAFT_894635 [Dichomitus squalens]